MLAIQPIVGGQGEVEAVKALLYRIAAEAGRSGALRVLEPFRVIEAKFINQANRDYAEYFNKYLGLAAAKVKHIHADTKIVLILLDCDDGEPCKLGSSLLARASQARSDVRFLVALACREYESWFLAAARSLAGCHGLPENLEPPHDSTVIRGAKEWLSQRMGKNCGYKEVTHQLAFTKVFDLDQAKANPSFARFYERIDDILSSAP